MSEEILKALAQLYAIITKQDDGVTEREREYVINSFKSRLDLDSVGDYIALYDEFAGYGEKESADDNKEEKAEKLTSVKDSVRTLAICKKINKTLTQKQKVIVLIELLEMVKSDGNFTPQRMQIIDTVSSAFNIAADEYKTIEQYVLEDDMSKSDNENVLVISKEKNPSLNECKTACSPNINNTLYFLRIKSVELIFVKHYGLADEYQLNGLRCRPRSIQLFARGSIIKSSFGGSFFYSDIISYFISEINDAKLSFNVKNVEFRFPNKAIGLRDINISEGPGSLIGIMGASGAGKTTLLNVMAGLETPSKGEVLLNDINIHLEADKIMGTIGYIAQDDLLIEELTVFDNIFYNTKLCFKKLSDAEITKKVNVVLENLGLSHISHLQVGNPLNKTISGGQRKRLNIALELIREPQVLFVDEPTSGLSSRDSENVIDLLKELSLKGKLIFVVIHQPSSEIYKMFDKMCILDTGGYQIFYGNPIEAVSYFKKISGQADSDKGQCLSCGNVNPEQIFNIIEEKVVDEYGNFTNKRKISTDQWDKLFKENHVVNWLKDVKDQLPGALLLPSKATQMTIFAIRDLKAKLSNQQYLLINLLEAPLLAFLLAFIIRYHNSKDQYLFRYNDNLPAYIFMSIIVAIFMGLSISAEEIIKDKKILKREAFLKLSRFSYLNSKILILFSFSAIQTLLYVLVGNTILEIKGMYLAYWLILFSSACMANILGLIISSAFSSAVTVYILIPLLLIPQMILSGAIFNFDKINELFRAKDKVPLVADMMVSRWAFEAIAVHQFQNNDYQKPLYLIERQEQVAAFNNVYLLPTMNTKFKDLETLLAKNAIDENFNEQVELLRNEIKKHRAFLDKDILEKLEATSNYKLQLPIIGGLIEQLDYVYNQIYNDANTKKDIYFASNKDINTVKNAYFNESLAELVRNIQAKEKLVETDGRFIPKSEPVFFSAFSINGPLDYRAHFFAPVKQFAGKFYNTLLFNAMVIWTMCICLYLFLYFDVLSKSIILTEKAILKFKNLNR